MNGCPRKRSWDLIGKLTEMSVSGDYKNLYILIDPTKKAIENKPANIATYNSRLWPILEYCTGYTFCKVLSVPCKNGISKLEKVQEQVVKWI